MNDVILNSPTEEGTVTEDGACKSDVASVKDDVTEVITDVGIKLDSKEKIYNSSAICRCFILVISSVIIVVLLAAIPSTSGVAPLTIKLQLYSPDVLEFKLSIIYELEYVPLTNCGVYVAKVTPDCIQLTVTLTVVSTEEGS